jgi:hypothetical protein
MIMVSTTTTDHKAVTTAGKQLKPFCFKEGASGNPLGRPKGSRNKLSEAVIKDILADWEVAGPSAIQACRLEDPAAYLRIVTSLVPKEFNIKDSESALASIIDQFEDEQLDQFLGLLNSIADGSLTTQGKGQKTKALPRS